MMSFSLAVPTFAVETPKEVRAAFVGKTFILSVPNPDNLNVAWAISDSKIVKATYIKDNPNRIRVTPIKDGEFFISTTVGTTKYKTYFNAKTFRSSKEIVDDMGVGINLSNTFDAVNLFWLDSNSISQLETGWQPSQDHVVTKQLVNTIAEAGFDSIRIPISWSKALEEDNLTIRKDWMARIKEVVDWCLDAGLYVIINTHHDNGYVYEGGNSYNYFALEPEYYNRTKERFKNLWTQIAEEFKNYDDRLIFEDLNEPTELEHWAEDTYGTTIDNLNELH
jgi:aryl-phospho-beta-D-glucosidase BglC (GH1 family)